MPMGGGSGEGPLPETPRDPLKWDPVSSGRQGMDSICTGPPATGKIDSMPSKTVTFDVKHQLLIWWRVCEMGEEKSDFSYPKPKTENGSWVLAHPP